MKPIHKYNNGNGATLCHQCSVIINTGLTNDLYCENCQRDLFRRGSDMLYTTVTYGADVNVPESVENFLKSLHYEDTEK